MYYFIIMLFYYYYYVYITVMFYCITMYLLQYAIAPALVAAIMLRNMIRLGHTIDAEIINEIESLAQYVQYYHVTELSSP